jgi:hypothetical protein
VIRALRPYKEDVARTLTTIARLRPEFVNAAISELAIKDRFRPLAATALDEAMDLLRSV